MSDPVAGLTAAVAEEAARLQGEELRTPPKLERPPKPELGDYSTNAAMLLAPALGEPPRDIAERLGEALRERLGDSLERAEVAGPGFLNLWVSDSWLTRAVAGALAAGDRYGAGDPEAGEHLSVEFVSANPTGPITVASGRHAAYGDALCRILERAGRRVEREYYVNDYGSQVRRFAESIRARARGEEPPEDGYHGDYVAELAARIEGAAQLDDHELGRRGIDAMLADVRSTLERFRVRIDRFESERALHEESKVAAAIERLRELGHVYSHEGAEWLRTTSFGDDKDRVLLRSSGEPTYLAADIPYHQEKRARGFDRVIDVWGADHHGHVAPVRAAWEALGADPERLELIIMQLVNLLEGGRRAQMSKREGTVVTLDALLDDIGVDATRWFLLQRSHDTTLDLDLDLARRQSQDNPVFYAQYAHARIASILRRAGEERAAAALEADVGATEERLHPSARSLVKRLLAWPGEVQEAAERRAPHRMTTAVTEIAQDFSGFYRDCKVVGAEEEGGDENFRLALSELTRRTIAGGLDLLGVEAPDEM